MNKPINVLSMCDGIGTGKIALAKAGIPVKYYLAAEIDPHCIKASHANYPEIIQLGNIYDINVAKIPFQIDLVFCGFPCQSFSVAGKQKKFDDPRGQVFWQGMKILYQCMKRWPNVKFLFENVRMDKHSCSIISNAFGFYPIFIDSALVSAQTRKRYYWTNIAGIEQPEDRGIILQDILEDNVDEKYNLSDTILSRINTDEVCKKLYKLKLEREKSRAVISSVGSPTDREYFEKNQGQLVEVVAKINKSQDGKDFAVTGKSQCLSAGHNNTPKIVQLNPAKEFGNQPRNQHRIYDADYKCPSINSSKAHTINIAKVEKQIIKIGKNGKIKANQLKANCLTGGGHSGGNHSDMDVLPEVRPYGGAIRGRYNEDGTTLELNWSSKSNALTTVEKDNIVAVGVVNSYGSMRTLKDKSLNIDANYYKSIDNHAARTHVAHLAEDVVVHNLQPRQGKGQGGKGHIMRYPGNKPYCLDTACGQAVEMDLIIRRLTPTECHRLQGIPTTEKTFTFNLCLDQAKSLVSAVQSSHKLQKLVLSAATNLELLECVNSVINSMQPKHPHTKRTVLIDVSMLIKRLTNSANLQTESLSHAGCVKQSLRYHDLESGQDFAHYHARMCIDEGSKAAAGRVEYHQTGQQCMPALLGSMLLCEFGQEIVELAKDVDVYTFLKLIECSTSIISSRLSTKNIEHLFLTLSCFAALVTCGYTLGATRTSNLCVSLIFKSTYLSMLSDTQQYKALGNGWQADTIAHILSYYKQ